MSRDGLVDKGKAANTLLDKFQNKKSAGPLAKFMKSSQKKEEEEKNRKGCKVLAVVFPAVSTSVKM